MKKHRQGTEPEEVLFLVYKNTVSYLAHFVKHLGQGLSARLRIPCAAALIMTSKEAIMKIRMMTMYTVETSINFCDYEN